MIKKIESKKDLKKKVRRNQFILAGVLVLVLFGSVFGMVVSSFGKDSSTTKELNFNGYLFKMENGLYTTKVGDSKFSFLENPKEVESLKKEVNLTKVLSDYAGENLYILSEDYSYFNEISQNLNPFVSRIQGACKEGEKCIDENLPIKTCEDNLIIIKESESDKIYEDKNCIYIEGKKEDLLKLIDEFLLRIIGIK